MSDGFTPISTNFPAVSKVEGFVLSNLKEPVSVKRAVYKQTAVSRLIFQPIFQNSQTKLRL